LNYLAGLISHHRSSDIIKGDFLVQILQLQFRYFNKKDYLDQKAFDLCFLQSLALQLTSRADDIERESPELYNEIVKTIFEEGRKGLSFVYGTVLRGLL